MVLEVAYAAISHALPSDYYYHVAFSLATLFVLRAFSQGRTTTRERDLHARVIIVTGAFTPLGITTVSALAARGAHIIALSPYPLDHPQPSLLVPLLRTSSNNENIYAEYVDFADPNSVRDFCTRFLTGADQRVDALVFAHEYETIGSFFGNSKQRNRANEEKRVTDSLASFLLITLLLPALLTAPAERDIRIVNVINPFYAAAERNFTKLLLAQGPPPPSSTFLQEGHRALRTAILTRHLQRILDALPNRAPAFSPDDIPTPPVNGPPGPSTGAANTQPKPASGAPKQSGSAADTSSSGAPPLPHPSNILAVTACPGISRKDTLAPLLGASRDSRSTFGLLMYILLLPVLFILTKSPTASIQSVLHALFLPTPLRRILAAISASADPQGITPQDSKIRRKDVEVLKPGALYRECAVVTLNIPPLPKSAESDGKGEGKKGNKKTEVDVPIIDDGEYGGEEVGRAVWEWHEARLKAWEASVAEKAKDKNEDPSSADIKADEVASSNS